MNQTCKVCGEPAAGFHFGAFTCEGCKSFFGRSYNNLSSISECKNGGKCIIDKKNRTTCKACRLRKCYTVGMSKGGSRYGRRSNWFKIHCLLQEQQQQAVEAAGKVAAGGGIPANTPNGFSDMLAAAQQHMQQRNPHMAAAHGLLSYPTYLSDMMQPSTAGLPFINIMNTLPHGMGGAPPNAFQLAPHMLFPGYAHSAAADAAYHSEMYRLRQSVDSTASNSSTSPRYSPSMSARSPHSSVNSEQLEAQSHSHSARASPELCVSGDDEDVDVQVKSPLTGHHPMHSLGGATRGSEPQAISPALPTLVTPALPISHANSPLSASSSSKSHTPEPHVAANSSSEARLAFPAQMVSPVSPPASETTRLSAVSSPIAEAAQDAPIDLSMKATRFSYTDAADSAEQNFTLWHRKLSQHLEVAEDEHESSASFDSSSPEGSKRQRLADNETATSPQNYSSSFAQPSVRRVFVCV